MGRPRSAAKTPEERYIASAARFITEHPAAWCSIRRHAAWCMKKGERFSVKSELARVRRGEWIDARTGKPGGPVKVTNNAAPVLARVLLMEFPNLSEVMHTRKSRFEKKE